MNNIMERINRALVEKEEADEEPIVIYLSSHAFVELSEVAKGHGASGADWAGMVFGLPLRHSTEPYSAIRVGTKESRMKSGS